MNFFPSPARRQPLSEQHAQCLARWTQPVIEGMRIAARECGYALATHGSMAFDIDILLVPWVEDAEPPTVLIPRLRAECSKVTGMPTYFWGMPCEDPEMSCGDDFLLEQGKRPDDVRPHGRISWSWQLGGGAYVDCSVMPLQINS